MALTFTRVATLDEARALTPEELFALGLLPPIAGASDGDDDSDDDTSGDSGSDDDAGDEDADDSSDDDDDAKDAKSEPDWKQMARKHEREAKKLRREKERLEREATERADAEKSEQQKAIDQARADAKAELQDQHDKERRQDRLETASAKLAAKGLKVNKDGDPVRFTDPDDALVYLERDIQAGTVDHDDLFDANGRVRTDALEAALTDVLSRKPHLGTDTSKKGGKVNGTADAGKGAGATDSDLSVEDHFKRIRRPRPEVAASQVISRRQ